MKKESLDRVFNIYATKKVTKTDKDKGAYVLNKAQCKVFDVAGKKPGDEISIYILGDKDRKSVRASYYHSRREGSNRLPEPRMGLEIISAWLNVGDVFLLATDEIDLFAIKLNDNILSETSSEDDGFELISELPVEVINRRAKSAPRKAKKVKSNRAVYIRDPYIIEFAKRRAAGKCEMPGCKYKAFIAENGKPYLEGHHIQPLSENGEDSVDNVAALCPACHREQHYAIDRLDKRNTLRIELDNILQKK